MLYAISVVCMYVCYVYIKRSINTLLQFVVIIFIRHLDSNTHIHTHAFIHMKHLNKYIQHLL